MKKVTKNEFCAFLEKAGVKSSDNVFVHSSLGHLGMVENTSVADIPQTLTTWLQQAVGENGAVFMPNYAYSFPRSRCTDLRTQPSEVGTWTEWFRQRPEALLSGHPMFSIAGIGKSAAEICRPDVPDFSPFSQDSTFHRLFENNAMMLFLGVDLAVATFMVYCEQQIGVAYRFLKPFEGDCILQNGQTVRGNYYHFCYPLEGGYNADFSDFQMQLLAQGHIQFSSIGYGKGFAIRMRDFYQLVSDYITTHKWGLLSAQPEFYCRYEDGVEQRYPVA